MAGVIAVCGAKDSGKTTLIAKMVSRLSDKGYKAAVISLTEERAGL